MTKAQHIYRATCGFTCPKTARDWKMAQADRTDPLIERMHIEAGDLVRPPCNAALSSWLVNDMIEEVSENGRPA